MPTKKIVRWNDATKIEIREEVMWFAEQMERKLRDNDYKGGWQKCTIGYLRRSMENETQELQRAVIALWVFIENGYAKSLRGNGKFVDVTVGKLARQTIKEATDVANFAMMIADNVRRLYAGQD